MSLDSGVGNSKAQNQTTSSNVDQRVVGGDSSVNTSTHVEVGGTNNTVTTSDYGAVAGALRLAFAGVEQANQLAKDTVAANGTLLTGALQMSGEQQQAFTNTVSNIKTSDVRVLVIAGLAVVGLGVSVAFSKG